MEIVDKSMGNVKEISSIRRSSSYTNTNRSDARDRFRYLNASHRSTGRTNYRSYKRQENNNYNDFEDTYVEKTVSSEKADKSFRRLMISTGVVAFVLVIKLMDNSVTDKLELSMSNLIRNSSEFDSKISNQLVSLTEKMGINIKGMDNAENINVNGDSDGLVNDVNSIDGTVVEDAEKTADTNQEVVEENFGENADATASTDSEKISDDQVADFYIDDSVFEEIKGDSKK